MVQAKSGKSCSIYSKLISGIWKASFTIIYKKSVGSGGGWTCECLCLASFANASSKCTKICIFLINVHYISILLYTSSVVQCILFRPNKNTITANHRSPITLFFALPHSQSLWGFRPIFIHICHEAKELFFAGRLERCRREWASWNAWRGGFDQQTTSESMDWSDWLKEKIRKLHLTHKTIG